MYSYFVSLPPMYAAELATFNALHSLLIQHSVSVGGFQSQLLSVFFHFRFQSTYFFFSYLFSFVLPTFYQYFSHVMNNLFPFLSKYLFFLILISFTFLSRYFLAPEIQFLMSFLLLLFLDLC